MVLKLVFGELQITSYRNYSMNVRFHIKLQTVNEGFGKTVVKQAHDLLEVKRKGKFRV